MTVAEADFTRVDPRRPDIVAATTWPRSAAALRRLWTGVIMLPDRGRAAAPQDLPPEYYRFPAF